MASPLQGLRVLDLTNVLAGPFCTHQLAHMGAEVIKVETIGRGDLARQLGADPDLNAAGMGVSFLAQNAGKKSVTLNLKHETGKALFKQMVANADILVENFRPGVMDRLGLGYAVLKDIKPDLIYCAISGFGQDGPWVDRPAYDQIIQGASGVMSITGDADSAPLRVGYPVADTMGGMTAAFAICAALQGKPRGAFIDVSMLASMLASMGWVVSNHLIAGAHPQANGNENPTSAPSGTFEAKDGPLNIAANKDEQWVLLTDHLGLAHLRDLPNYINREARKANRVKLKSVLEEALAAKNARVWAEELNALGVPAGAVMDVADILRHPQIAERGFLNQFDDVPGIDRPVDVVTTGFQLDGEAPKVSDPPPELGQDNEAIFGELGLDAYQIDALKKAGIV